MKNLFKNIILTIIGVVGFTACSETDYLKYDTSYNGIYFTKDKLKYSFSVSSEDVKSYLFKMPIQVLGAISNQEREVAYRVVEDSTDAEEGIHYTLGKAIIAPDSITGYIPVTILRDNLEGSYAEGYTTYRLYIELVANEHFTPTLDTLSQARLLQFDNAIDIPEWTNDDGEKLWRPGNPHENLGSWHPYTFIKLVEYFHTIKNVEGKEESYYQMVDAWGENLERVKYGSFFPHTDIMRMYVFNEIYKFLNENKDEILEMYPDYPFDFPDPYKAGEI